MGIVYQCKITNLYYIGITTRTLEERKREHYKSDYKLGKLLKENDNAEWKIIYETDINEELQYLEQRYIDFLIKNGFGVINETIGGEGVIINDSAKEEWLKKHLKQLDWMHKNKNISKKISKSLKQKYENPEYKEWRMNKLREARNKRNEGKQVSMKEHKMILEENIKKKEELNNSPIVDLVSGKAYDTIGRAMGAHNLSESTIRYQLNGKRKIPLYSSKNKKLLKFQYVNKENS